MWRDPKNTRKGPSDGQTTGLGLGGGLVLALLVVLGLWLASKR